MIWILNVWNYEIEKLRNWEGAMWKKGSMQLAHYGEIDIKCYIPNQTIRNKMEGSKSLDTKWKYINVAFYALFDLDSVFFFCFTLKSFWGGIRISSIEWEVLESKPKQSKISEKQQQQEQRKKKRKKPLRKKSDAEFL